MAIETPEFEILKKLGKYEIRQYQGYTVAYTDITAKYNSALEKGFAILADYIFGNNKSRTELKMTAPVTTQALKSEKIRMTAPVTLTTTGEEDKYRVSFIMPGKFHLETLPEPNNKQISFLEFKPFIAAVYRFSGYLNEKNSVKKSREMASWLQANQLKPKSSFNFAQYDPPWIPGPFRRNEILVEV